MPSQVAMAQKKAARFFKKKKAQLKAKLGGEKKARNAQQTQWQAGVHKSVHFQPEIGMHRAAKPAHVYDDDADKRHYDDDVDKRHYDDEADEVETEARQYDDEADVVYENADVVLANKTVYENVPQKPVYENEHIINSPLPPKYEQKINEPFGQQKGGLVTTPLMADYRGEDQVANPHLPTKKFGMNMKLTKYAASADEHKATISDGQLHRPDGSVADSSGIEPMWKKDKAERFNFAMDSRGQTYLSDPKAEFMAGKAEALANGSTETKRINHSTMLAGGDIAGAGTVRLREGKVETLVDGSGHYQPTATQTAQVTRTLANQGVMDPSRSNVELTGKKGAEKDLLLSAQELLSYGEGKDDRFAAGIAEYEQTGNKQALARVEAEIRGRHDAKSQMLVELLQKVQRIG